MQQDDKKEHRSNRGSLDAYGGRCDNQFQNCTAKREELKVGA